jgi:hypothetical protein
MPNLFIIGAAKCGTTSLHYYLDLHPEISMSLEKEPNYFAPPGAKSLHQRIGEREIYLSLFEAGTPVRGEASTAYTRFPVVPGVPEAIASEASDPKFVFLVRDPVDRVEAEMRELLSNRTGAMKHLPADMSAGEVLGNIQDPANRFTSGSRYMTQIHQYLEVFSRDSLLVVDSDQLRSRRGETMARIFGFLGVQEGFWDERMDLERNTAAEKKRRSELYVRMSEVPVLKAAADRIPVRTKRDVFKVLRSSLSKPWTPPRLDDDLRFRLESLYRPEVEELREFTGQDFAGWSI